jgi:4'-phosphopantetheinyl transferase
VDPSKFMGLKGQIYRRCSESGGDGTISLPERCRPFKEARSALIPRTIWLTPRSYLRGSTGLSDGDVHLWYASLDQFETGPLLHTTLSADEQAERGSFLRERDWRRYVVGRSLLRVILGRYLGIAPGEIRIAYDCHGKPSLEGPRNVRRLRFNLSHSKGSALYAVTLDREIGVDLECVSVIPEIGQIADRFFSKQERALIHALRGVRKYKAFFRIWTQREALLKAGGQGLSGLAAMAGDSMNWAAAKSLRCLGPNKDRPSGLSVEELDICPGFAAAVAAEGPIGRLVCREWSFGVV